jgi:hypothetical protein
MKTAGRGTQNRYAIVRSQPSTWSGRQEQILLNYVGWKVRKNPATGEIFFLTFPFIELTRWDEKAGLPRDAISSQCSTRSWRNEKETGDEEA